MSVATQGTILLVTLGAACAVAADPPSKDAPIQREFLPTGLNPGALAAPFSEPVQMLAFAAYADDNWDIFTWDLDPADPPVQRTKTPYDEAGPSLARDHSFCVYESVDGRLWQLDLRTAAEPVELPHASDTKLDVHPAVSPDGTRVVMATSLNRASDDSDLVVYRLDKREFMPRMELLAYQHYPTWSPDGCHVAFANLHGRLWTGGPLSEIWVMRTDAPWARQLTLLDSFSISPAWSPSGELIVFASNRGGDFNIWQVDPHSRAFAQLTHDPAADTDPAFSPTGAEVVFVSTRGGSPGLWVLNLADGACRSLNPFGADRVVPCRDPDWR
jgi:Tol biopolymer transport system component